VDRPEAPDRYKSGRGRQKRECRRAGCDWKIGIAAGDEDEVALECAALVDGSGAVDAGMETVISAELREESASVSVFVVEAGTNNLSAFSA